MASSALDLATIGHALNALLEEGIGNNGWQAVSLDQQWFLEWYVANRELIARLDSLTAKASSDFKVLNEFLEEHGFEPKFEKLDGIGVVSILDMLVEWLVECKTATIERYDNDLGYVDSPAFEVPAQGVTFYALKNDRIGPPLVELRTKSGHSLWLREASQPLSGLELASQAQRMLVTPLAPDYRWTDGVIVPMLEMNLDTDLDWLAGLATAPDWRITKANQQFKLRANEKGARVKVATSLTLERAMASAPQPYIFRNPFIGCFTQPGHPDIALAAFYADVDSWRNPEGTLEEL
jgi:hypothetical protein